MNYPQLPYPTFLSPQLDDYLKRISEQVGRVIVFAHGRNEHAKASAFAYPDVPALVVVVDNTVINPANYNPKLHDPIIAHEVTHMQLLVEGWSEINWDEPADEQTKYKANTVYNWLTDPIINQRISNIGLSLANDRRTEIKDSIRGLRKHLWSRNLKIREQDGIGDWYVVRVFVSFCLEPEIENSFKITFRQEFQKDLPELYETANKLLNLINQNGFDTAEKYESTAILCLQNMGVQRQQFWFGEPLRRYTVEEQQEWASTHGNPEATWGDSATPAEKSQDL